MTTEWSRWTYHHTELDWSRSRSRTRLRRTFRTFGSVLCSFSPQSQHRKTNLSAAAATGSGAALGFDFIFLAVLPPPFGGFWTRFSGLFGQVERDPEEAEFQLWAGPTHAPRTGKLPPTTGGPLPVGTFRSKTTTLKTLKPFKKATLKPPQGTSKDGSDTRIHALILFSN